MLTSISHLQNRETVALRKSSLPMLAQWCYFSICQLKMSIHCQDNIAMCYLVKQLLLKDKVLTTDQSSYRDTGTSTFQMQNKEMPKRIIFSPLYSWYLTFPFKLIPQQSFQFFNVKSFTVIFNVHQSLTFSIHCRMIVVSS